MSGSHCIKDTRSNRCRNPSGELPVRRPFGSTGSIRRRALVPARSRRRRHHQRPKERPAPARPFTSASLTRLLRGLEGQRCDGVRVGAGGCGGCGRVRAGAAGGCGRVRLAGAGWCTAGRGRAQNPHLFSRSITVVQGTGHII